MDCSFFKRRRKFNPVPALWSFVTAMASGTANTLADIRRVFCDLTNDTIEYKPFHDRLSNRKFPEFMRQTFEATLSSLTDQVSKSESRYLKCFKDILIQDGSSFALNENLAKDYPGRFKTISPAAWSLDTLISRRPRLPKYLTRRCKSPISNRSHGLRRNWERR